MNRFLLTVCAAIATVQILPLVSFPVLAQPLEAGIEEIQTATTDPPEPIAIIIPTTNRYKPEVEFISPQPGDTLASTTVFVELDVKRLPVMQDPRTGLGFHINIIVDNGEPIQYFDLDRPLELELEPGTHTIRAIATRPWGVSYRGFRAYDLVTFNVIEADGQNAPVFGIPKALLTVNSPSGTYGGEPIVLDYLVDGINLGRNLYGARIRYTLNGESTQTVNRKPLFLSGLKPGANQLVVELLQSNGEVFDNQGTGYNRVERTIIFNPGGTDSLSSYLRGELSPSDIRGALGPSPFIYDDKGNPKILR